MRGVVIDGDIPGQSPALRKKPALKIAKLYDEEYIGVIVYQDGVIIQKSWSYNAKH